MSNNYQYTTVDRIINKFSRELKDTDLDEADAIEYIGEALEFLRVAETQEEALAFIPVVDYHADIPDNFQLVLQIAKYLKGDSNCLNSCANAIAEEQEVTPTVCGVPIDSETGVPLVNYDIAYYRPYYDVVYEYGLWTNSTLAMNDFGTVRLSNNTMLGSLVCAEKKDVPYIENGDEYTIVGTTDKRLRFSFKDGVIALSYIRTALDKDTGYPLIPDHISTITAITYYIKWKIAERNSWNGREGFRTEADSMEKKWLKYCRQAKNSAKMPKTLDDFQNHLEQSHYIIPRHNKYYGYMGNLGRKDNITYNK